MVRINTKWWSENKKGRASLSENAGTMAFISWRASQETLLHLENEDFQTDSLAQRMDVIKELVYFATHICDRWCFETIPEDREEFVIAMIKNLARTYQASMEDIAGVKDYKEEFFNQFNERLADYSELPFNEEEQNPSFQMYAYLGGKLSDVMGERHNRWIQDQVVEIDGKDLVKNLRKGFEGIFKPAFSNMA